MISLKFNHTAFHSSASSTSVLQKFSKLIDIDCRINDSFDLCYNLAIAAAVGADGSFLLFLSDLLADMDKFMDSGGQVLWAIAVLLFVMWTLIFERIWYLRGSVSSDIGLALTAWRSRSDRVSKRARQVREKLISEVDLKIDQNVMMIKTLVALAPLFGLLGTVTGMIVVFDVMAYTGGGDAKAMAGGVSKATIPTMSGMVAALSGVFGLTIVEKNAARKKSLLENSLNMEQ